MDLNHPLLAGGALDDPPPFPANQPQLQRLDRALQCQICKEPFQGPVSIGCGHSFCSQCIRSSLDTLKKCPSCGETAGEGSIRRNRALEEMVDAWEEARPVMITLSKPLAPKRRAEGSGPNSRVKRLRLSDGVTGSLHGATNGESSRSRSTSERPVSRASGSASPRKEGVLNGQDHGTGQSPSGAIELGSSDAEEDELFPGGDGHGIEEGVEVEVEELSENDEGECPLCQARLPIAAIPAHIERNCEPPKTRKTGIGLGGVQGTGNARADWKKVFGGVTSGGPKGVKETPSKRLTKFNFSLSPPSALRSFLATHSLPTIGDRPTLEARVSEWILLYNSNLDTSHPRSLPALRAKLAEMEASRKRDKEKGKEALGEKIATKAGMQEYAKERKAEFERLRELAGRGRRKGRDGGGEGEGQVGAEMKGDGEGASGGGRGGSEGAAILVD